MLYGNYMHVQRTTVNKPWGHEVIWAKTPAYVGKLLHVNAGHKLSRQYHAEKDETFYVQAGAMVLEVGIPGQPGFQSVIMGVGNSFHCPPGTVHRMCAGVDGCDVIEVSTPQLDDVVRIEDDYGR